MVVVSIFNKPVFKASYNRQIINGFNKDKSARFIVDHQVLVPKFKLNQTIGLDISPAYDFTKLLVKNGELVGDSVSILFNALLSRMDQSKYGSVYQFTLKIGVT